MKRSLITKWKKYVSLLIAVAILSAGWNFSPDKSLAADDYSQTESFESASVPAGWSTENGGTAAVSSKHYKHGQRSLLWTWSNGSKLRDTQPANLAAANVKNGGMKLWIYNETPVNDKITFNFGKISEINTGVYHYTFSANLNFKGWRAIWVKFREEGNNPAYTKSQSNALEVMQIVPPASVPSGSLYLDNLEFSPSMIKARTADYQMPKPGIDVGASTWDNVYHYSQQQPTIPLESAITPQQIASFDAIASKYEKWVYGDALQYASLSGPLQTRYNSLQTFITAGLAEYDSLNIARHPDGSVTGAALYASRDPHLRKFGEDVSKRVLLPLVFDYKINGNAASKQKVIDVLDYMNDQGWAEGSALGTQDHEMNKNNGYFHTVYLMRNELKAAGIYERESRTSFWYSNFGKTFDNSVYEETTPDEFRTKFLYDLLYVLGMDHTPKKVQYMKGLTGMYEQALQTAPGYAGTIKPDGTLFHHRGVYLNAYGPDALHAASLIAYFLNGTPFALSESSFNNIKKGLLTIEQVSNLYDMPIGATGRFPGQTRAITNMLPAYAYLAQAKSPVDSELASTFMRLWDPQSSLLQNELFPSADTYGVSYLDTLGGLQLAVTLSQAGYSPKANPQGFWVKPYGAMAVNRINDRLVGLKGWSQYAWDFEASNKFDPQTTENLSENLYGRYQNYGNLQIIKNGPAAGITESGINVGAGWDWSRWPGTTVKHLSLAELALPEGGPTRSFTDSTFVGGVSHRNQYGLFAMKLHDPVYDTSFRANKSVFFFGDKIVSLGSDIQNSDSAHATETILFQSYMSSSSVPFWFNSTTPIVSPTYNNTITGTSKAWLVDPYGNGYVLPSPAGTVIARGVQNSKNSSGAADTSGNYTTAYINHGTAPAASGYEYAIKVGAGAQGTADFAANTQYTVLQKNSNAHIVQNTEPGRQITGYAIFNSSIPVTQGLLRGSSDPVTVMIEDISASEVVLSVSDPDLRLPKYPNQAIPAADVLKPSILKKDTVTLNGVWHLKNASSEARVISSNSATTTVEFDAVDGKTIEIGLVK
ncbi:chondroitinase family polysaccharide lyase [Paenibacillus sp. FJAT-26967]|uniref:chondroitinase family polysaccharide lyase n=1 Tax=Paenibacillus sp. FJAT-26967 TaxID=1729690 RepID=UPI000837E31E|nr:chondroitinase family polysaccharide lyase [Paenibacillus sp. FJAT-26967]